jgi:hypothetical protein
VILLRESIERPGCGVEHAMMWMLA